MSTTNISLQIEETTPLNEVIHNTVLTGNLPITYSLSGADSDDFNLNPSTGELTFASIPDYENPTDGIDNQDYS